MNSRAKIVFRGLVAPRSIILWSALLNFILIWTVARQRSMLGITCAACPWYYPWYWDNPPTRLLIAAIVLRLNRFIGSLVALLITGYFLWNVGTYFVVMPDSFHYEWLWVLRVRTDPFEVLSGHGQYVLAVIIFCCSIFYLTKTILRASALRRTADNKSLDASGGSVFRIMTGPAMVA